MPSCWGRSVGPSWMTSRTDRWAERASELGVVGLRCREVRADSGGRAVLLASCHDRAAPGWLSCSNILCAFSMVRATSKEKLSISRSAIMPPHS